MLLLLRLLLTLLCSFASKVSCFSSSKSSSSFSPPQPQLPLWPVCLLQPSGCFCIIGNTVSIICCQRSPMVIALVLQPQQHWCAIISFNPRKCFLKGNLCDANCCKSCSCLTRMRRSCRERPCIRRFFSLFFFSQFQGQDAVYGHPGCFAVALLAWRSSSVLRAS